MTPWMEIAWQQEGAGVAEIGGPQAHKSIVAYFHEIQRPDITSDEVPWCAAFYFWCLNKAGISVDHIPKELRLLAYTGVKLGKRISEPRVGCGCIMKRPGGHHIGFVTKWTATTITLLGGNQANSVCERTFKRTPEMIFMWPDVVTPKDLDAAGSRISAGAKRVGKDTVKGGATQIAPPPPAFDIQPPPAPPIETLPLPPATSSSLPLPHDLPPPDAILGKASLLQSSVEQAMAFSTFLHGRWPWVMLAVAAYYGARAIWTSSLIRKWRAEDASTGKTVAPPTSAPDTELDGDEVLA